MKPSGSRCRLRDGVCWDACLEADIVLAFVATATHDSLHHVRPTQKEDSERSGFPRAEGGLEYAVQRLGKQECCNSGSPAFGSLCNSGHDEIEAGARKSDPHLDESLSDSDAQVCEANHVLLRPASSSLSLPKVNRGKAVSDHHCGEFVPEVICGDRGAPVERNGDVGPGCQYFAEACEEAFSEKGMSEGVRGEVGDKVREFVGLWSRVQAAVWHVNTCLGVLGLLGTSRDRPGYCTAVNPLSLRPAFALEIFLCRRKYRRRTCLRMVGEQRCRRCPSKTHDLGNGDHLREDCPCPWDGLLKGGCRGKHAMGPREGYCCCWWHSMAGRCRGDCNWASRMRIVLGTVAACRGS